MGECGTCDSRLDEPPSLCLAGVLVDDVGGDGLLLLLLPHQQDALVDEHVLLLHRRTACETFICAGTGGEHSPSVLAHGADVISCHSEQFGFI